MLALMQAVGVLLGLVYLDQNYDQKGVMNMNGCMFLLQQQMTTANVLAVVNVSSSRFWLLHAVTACMHACSSGGRFVCVNTAAFLKSSGSL